MTTLPHKIYIIGTSGSGKTTLALKLSRLLELRHIDLDLIRYPNHRGKLSDKDSISAAKEIAKQDKWLAEGIYLYWVKPLLKSADQIIWVDTPKSVAVFRIVKRYFIHKIKGVSKHSFFQTIKFAHESLGQHDIKRQKLGKEDGKISPTIITNTLKPYQNKVVRIRNEKDLKKYWTSLEL